MKELSKVFYGVMIAFVIWVAISTVEVIAICQPQHKEPCELNFYSVLIEYCERGVSE